MNQALLAIAFVLVAWWASTGLVLAVVWLRRGRRPALGVASVLAVLAVAGVWWTAGEASVEARYAAFTCALVVWGWHELTFLVGAVTGPRRDVCPPGATGWRRFALGVQVVLHHELALLLTVVVLAVLTAGAPNQVGLWTFLVLWIMRISAKLNVFLGVRNLGEDLIPDHATYLRTYFRRARMNPLMPFSVLVPGALAVALFAAGEPLVGTILALAVVEHVFLVVPLPDVLLWRWATRRPSPIDPHPRPKPAVS